VWFFDSWGSNEVNTEVSGGSDRTPAVKRRISANVLCKVGESIARRRYRKSVDLMTSSVIILLLPLLPFVVCLYTLG